MADAMHGIYQQAIDESNEMFTQAAERFADIVERLKQMTSEMQHELETTRSELRRAHLPALLRREFAVTDTPHRAVCAGCPAEGGLCSWPLEMTRREAPDRLF